MRFVVHASTFQHLNYNCVSCLVCSLGLQAFWLYGFVLGICQELQGYHNMFLEPLQMAIWFQHPLLFALPRVADLACAFVVLHNIPSLLEGVTDLADGLLYQLACCRLCSA